MSAGLCCQENFKFMIIFNSSGQTRPPQLCLMSEIAPTNIFFNLMLDHFSWSDPPNIRSETLPLFTFPLMLYTTRVQRLSSRPCLTLCNNNVTNNKLWLCNEKNYDRCVVKKTIKKHLWINAAFPDCKEGYTQYSRFVSCDRMFLHAEQIWGLKSNSVALFLGFIEKQDSFLSVMYWYTRVKAASPAKRSTQRMQAPHYKL